MHGSRTRSAISPRDLRRRLSDLLKGIRGKVRVSRDRIRNLFEGRWLKGFGTIACHLSSRCGFELDEQIALHRGDEAARGDRRMQIPEVEIHWTTRVKVFSRSL